ncbi:MAG TPA: trypsin-like peptidase domain-containing protein [Anaerolineales bacterium]|nr:trypsin-like peptidase domain-containing protein [Anaerolineales bacterium]
MGRFVKRFVVLFFIILTICACEVSPVDQIQTPTAPTLIPSTTTEIFSSPQPDLKSSSQLLPETTTSTDILLLEERFVSVYEDASSGVVAIRSLKAGSGFLGSGFVYDSKGHIVTNYHVIDHHEEVEVSFQSGYSARGKVIGKDKIADLAVILVNSPSEELFPLALGKSELVKVGQIVVAIGNPYGLQGTMTVGIISGKGRALRDPRDSSETNVFTIGDILQTDAAIHPGNSGGPLLNMEAEVIGVNTSIASTAYSGSSSGVGFAISSDLAQRVVDALIADGEFIYPYIGLFSIREVTLVEREGLRLPQSTGIYVTGVDPEGPADQAGIRAGSGKSPIPGVPAGGDLIIGVDGFPVLNFDDLMVYLIKNNRPGDTIILTIIRDEKTIEIPLTLGERPG